MATFWRQATVSHQSEVDEDEIEDSHAAREADLIERAKQDPRAFAPLYEHYFSQVFGYCLRRIGHREAAADVTAQIFTRAIASLGKFRQRSNDGSSFRSWLFTIAHNMVIDHRRRTRHHSSIDVSTLSDDQSTSHWLHDPSPGPEEIAIGIEDRVRVRASLARLPERQREIVELRMAGLSGIEIASTLNMTHSAVKSAQFRAYVTLRDLLREDSPASSTPTSGEQT
jgi:RNA polymerase sigma-70 factor, ECF subfamily